MANILQMVLRSTQDKSFKCVALKISDFLNLKIFANLKNALKLKKLGFALLVK